MTDRPHPGTERPLEAPVLSFRLADELARLKGESDWTAGRRTITLAKQGSLRLVLIALRAGAALEEHVAPGVISVHVLEGAIRFTAEGRAQPLGPGDLLTLLPGRTHRVDAERDSAFLLTIAQEAGA